MNIAQIVSEQSSNSLATNVWRGTLPSDFNVGAHFNE